MNEISLPAPAKLNLMLHVTGKRDDGYHDLQSVFQFLDFGDTVRLTLRNDAAIVRTAGADIPAEEDLVVKAASLLQQHTGCNRGAGISVEKRIPLGAGLGGGSSDAATVLHGLNRLWDCRLDEDELAGIGLRIGADVPVFVRGYAAFAEGVGERLTPIQIAQHWYLVVMPQVHVSTAEIFGASELTRDCPTIKICDLFSEDGRVNWGNVCIPVVVQRHPEIGKALEILAEYAHVGMSGTGASVFACFDSEQEATRAMLTLRNDPQTDGWRFKVAQGLNRSPLMVALNA